MRSAHVAPPPSSPHQRGACLVAMPRFPSGSQPATANSVFSKRSSRFPAAKKSTGHQLQEPTLLACSVRSRRGRESHRVVENRPRSRLRLNQFQKSILTTLVKISWGRGEAWRDGSLYAPGLGCGGLRCCRGSLNARCAPHAAPLQAQWLLVVAVRRSAPHQPLLVGVGQCDTATQLPVGCVPQGMGHHGPSLVGCEHLLSVRFPDHSHRHRDSRVADPKWQISAKRTPANRDLLGVLRAGS